MNEEVLSNMMRRVERGRLLARQITDERAARALLAMTDEAQADIERLVAERARKGRQGIFDPGSTT